MLVPTVPHSSTLCQPVPSAVVVVRVAPPKSERRFKVPFDTRKVLMTGPPAAVRNLNRSMPVPDATLTLVLMHNWLTVVPR